MKRTTVIFLCIIVVGTGAFAQKSADVLAYIDLYKQIAIKEMKRTGVPAAVKLAQGIHETEAGKSNLVVKSNNHFGIKCKSSWTGNKVYHDDDARGECFRSYSRPEESYMDHSDFLKNSPRYAFLFDLDPTDFEGWAYGLKKAGYATNIRYSQVLINIIRNYQLEDYTLIALGKLKESDHTLAANTALIPYKIPSIEKEQQDIEIEGPAPSYPSGPFTINNTKVLFAHASTAWLSIADQYRLPMNRLWDFNDLEKDDDILKSSQLVYLQRKRKVGNVAFHIVRNGEDLYDICQSEGIRYESLLELNHLNGNMQPAIGEKLYLQQPAVTPPLLMNAHKSKVSSNGTNQPKAYTQESGIFNLQPNDVNNTETPSKAEYTTHVVYGKETLYSISKKYGVDLAKLKEWNRLNNQQLKVGQSLIIYKDN
ncbi:MAG: glucosaminidase domain-containing protein [Chitinophagaceae bacterium]